MPNGQYLKVNYGQVLSHVPCAIVHMGLEVKIKHRELNQPKSAFLLQTVLQYHILKRMVMPPWFMSRRDLVHLSECTFDRKRISANSNPNLNPIPITLTLPKAQKTFQENKMTYFSGKCPDRWIAQTRSVKLLRVRPI